MVVVAISVVDVSVVVDGRKVDVVGSTTASSNQLVTLDLLSSDQTKLASATSSCPVKASAAVSRSGSLLSKNAVNSTTSASLWMESVCPAV